VNMLPIRSIEEAVSAAKILNPLKSGICRVSLFHCVSLSYYLLSLPFSYLLCVWYTNVVECLFFIVSHSLTTCCLFLSLI
jgi:hypothetical protein